MNHSVQYWEYRLVEAMFVPDPQDSEKLSDQVMFFDHYANEYKGRKSDLDHYFAKLIADGWELTMGPWSYDNLGLKTQDAVRTRHSSLDRLFWMYGVRGKKLYRFKRPLRR